MVEMHHAPGVVENVDTIMDISDRIDAAVSQQNRPISEWLPEWKHAHLVIMIAPFVYYDSAVCILYDKGGILQYNCWDDILSARSGYCA